MGLVVVLLASGTSLMSVVGAADAESTGEDAPSHGVGTTPITSGWAVSHAGEAASDGTVDSSDIGGGVHGAVFEFFPETRTWCLGDDNEADPVGDPGPDLIRVGLTGACSERVGADVTMSVTTMAMPEAAEFLVNVDRDASTGCNGYDRAYVVINSGRGGALDVAMPSCDPDTWEDLPGGPGHGNNSGGVPPTVFLILPADQIREMSWTAGVGNLDGSNYDSAWTDFYVSTRTIECGTHRVTAADSDAGYLLMGMDGSVWTFGSALVGSHACRSGLGLSRIVDFEYIPAEGSGLDSWIALQADGIVSHRGAFQWLIGPQPWQVGAAEAVAILPLLDDDGWAQQAFIVYDNGAVEAIAKPGAAPATFGDVRHLDLFGPIIDAVLTPDRQGYWLVGTDGGVFSFGSARFYGSMGSVVLNQPVVAMVADPDGSGYWLVAADGGVFAFDAPYVGAVPAVLPPGQVLNRPIVGMTPYGDGYLMFASDGGVFNFSNLGFAGSLGDNPPLAPIIGVVAPPS